MKKNKLIIKQAKRLLPKVKSRAELMRILSKKYKLKTTAINSIFYKCRFKTNFISKFKNGSYKHDKILKENSLDFLKRVQRQPTFNFEFENSKHHHYQLFKWLKKNNYSIFKLRLAKSSSGSVKYNIKKRGIIVLYYLGYQRNEAFDKICSFFRKQTGVIPQTIRFNSISSVIFGKRIGQINPFRYRRPVEHFKIKYNCGNCGFKSNCPIKEKREYKTCREFIKIGVE